LRFGRKDYEGRFDAEQSGGERNGSGRETGEKRERNGRETGEKRGEKRGQERNGEKRGQGEKHGFEKITVVVSDTTGTVVTITEEQEFHFTAEELSAENEAGADEAPAGAADG